MNCGVHVLELEPEEKGALDDTSAEAGLLGGGGSFSGLVVSLLRGFLPARADGLYWQSLPFVKQRRHTGRPFSHLTLAVKQLSQDSRSLIPMFKASWVDRLSSGMGLEVIVLYLAQCVELYSGDDVEFANILHRKV